MFPNGSVVWFSILNFRKYAWFKLTHFSYKWLKCWTQLMKTAFHGQKKWFLCLSCHIYCKTLMRCNKTCIQRMWKKQYFTTWQSGIWNKKFQNQRIFLTEVVCQTCMLCTTPSRDLSEPGAWTWATMKWEFLFHKFLKYFGRRMNCSGSKNKSQNFDISNKIQTPKYIHYSPSKYCITVLITFNQFWNTSLFLNLFNII